MGLHDGQAPKHSLIGLRNILAFHVAHGCGALDDTIARNVGTRKTKAWAKRIHQERRTARLMCCMTIETETR